MFLPFHTKKRQFSLFNNNLIHFTIMRIISTSNVSDFTKVANNVICKDKNNIFLSLDNDIHSVLCVTNGMGTYGDICLSFGTCVMDEIAKYGKLANLANVHTIYVWDVSTFDYPKDSED